MILFASKKQTEVSYFVKSNINHEEQGVLASNLQLLIKEKNITLKKLSEDLDLPVMTIRRIVYGETTDPRLSTVKAFANYFDIDLNMLLTIKFKTVSGIEGVKPFVIPVYNWDSLDLLFRNKKKDITPLSWVPVFQTKNLILSNQSFAIQTQKYMSARFPEGSILVFDNISHLVDGDLVLIKDKIINTLLLREYEKNPPEEYLINIFDESHKTIILNKKQHKILAVNVKAILTSKN